VLFLKVIERAIRPIALGRKNALVVLSEEVVHPG
jgi:hypothetical protein